MPIRASLFPPLESITVADPPSGNNQFSITVPGDPNEIIEFLGLQFNLKTLAVAGLRVVRLVHSDSAVNTLAFDDSVSPTISINKSVFIAIYTKKFIGIIPADVTDTTINREITPQTFLNPGDTIVSSITNLKTGDQLSNIRFVFRKYKTGQP